MRESRRDHGRWFPAVRAVALILTLMVGIGGPLSGAAAQSPDDGQARVIAQGSAWLPAEPATWWISLQAAPAGPIPASFHPLGFVLGDSGTTTIVTEGVLDDQLVWLDPGEALFVPRDTRQDRLSTSFAATFYTLDLLPISATPGPPRTPVGAPFTPSPTLHELSLRRGVLGPGGINRVPGGAYPVLILATSGTIAVSSDSGGEFTLVAGEATTLDTAATITPLGPGPAAYVAAVVTTRTEQAPVTGVADLGLWVHHCPPGVIARPSMANAGCVIGDPLGSGVAVNIAGPALATPLTLATSAFGDAGARVWSAVPFGPYTLTATLPPGAIGYAVRPGNAGLAINLRPDGTGYTFTIDGSLFDLRDGYWRVNLDLYLLYP
ncbi:MAG: hypothetical protein M3464_22430 [Chloroflexota bacterium]|nr:hypothetical protein [Chloroflexota bacterium]